MVANPRDIFDDPTPLLYGRLQKKVAVITGASSGFGRAIAFRFSREGASIVCADITPNVSAAGSRAEDAGEQTDHWIVSKGGNAIFVRTDVSDADAMRQLIETTVETYGRIDIMVNNAGICPEGAPDHINKLVDDEDEEVWDLTMKVNARGTFLGCKYACKQFLKQEILPSGDRGWIVNIGSTASLISPGPGIIAYTASKGAVLQITRSTAISMAPSKIHCNILCPGDAFTAVYAPHINDEQAISASTAAYPWGRFGTLREIAGAALFLASEDAGYVTGAILSVDGGFTAQ